MSRVTNDVNVLEQFIVEGVRDGVVNVLKLTLIAGILLWTNPQLALLTLLPTAPLAWGTRAFLSACVRAIAPCAPHGRHERDSCRYHRWHPRGAGVWAGRNRSAKIRDKSIEFQQAGLSTNIAGVFLPSVNLAFGLGQVLVWLVGGRESCKAVLTWAIWLCFPVWWRSFTRRFRSCRR
jgi:hypothetical protein